MKLVIFLKDKLLYIFFSTFIIIVISIFMSILNFNLYIICILNFLYFLGCLIPIFFEYMKKREFYYKLNDRLPNLDKKYLLSEVIEMPDFLEGKMLYNAIVECNKSMNDEIAKYKILSKEYKEYMEMWIHEVKTPIASSKLIIENNPSEISLSLDEEIDEIDYYLEQALFYARSYSIEKDYIIKKTNLRELVNKVIRKNSKLFITNKIKLILENLDYHIYTDRKWLEFIINQIISNSIKYRSENPTIRIYAKKNKNNLCLYIKDNGIGIDKKDINKVFEKGYIGNTGGYIKSTGIGLYLCKKLCEKLGLYINLKSDKDSGVEIEIIFPQANTTEVIESKSIIKNNS